MPKFQAGSAAKPAPRHAAPAPSRPRGFSCTPDELRDLARVVLERAKRAGADGCDCEVSEAFGLTVTVRKGAADVIEHNRDRSVGVSIYLGGRPRVRRGHASTSDLSRAALEQTVDAAAAIARHTAEDDCAGLPDPAHLARSFPDLDLYHPWPLGTEEAIELARRCEGAAFAVSKKIRNSEGATVSAQHSQFVLANSLDFMGGYQGSRHYLSCSVIAEDKGLMQRDDWYSASRVPAKLADPERLGRYAGQRAAARLGARKIATCRAPVLFEAPVAIQFLGHFVSAANGGNLYRKTSFLLDSLGKTVFSPVVRIEEKPLLPQESASTAFDEEGVATRERVVVSDGVLEGYFLGSYSARKLGMQTTGNAGGHHNLVVRSDGPDFAGMLRKMGRGLLVTELLGHGVNLVTGDYSRGAAGYWVEGGEIRYPVEEITVAGNLRDMFRGVVAVGSDVLSRSGRSTGSILVDSMTIAGN
jgi:PmbA protein